MVIILAEESLKKSENLLVMDLHPSEVQVGEYRFACAKALGEHERSGADLSFNTGTAVSLASRNNNFKEFILQCPRSTLPQLLQHCKFLSKFDLCCIARAEHTKTRTATIVLSGATANHLDDIERAIDNNVNVIKSLIKDPRPAPGPSTTELEVSKRIEANGSGMGKLSQRAVKRYATALEFIPRTLAENALGGAESHEVLNSIEVFRFLLPSLQKQTIEGLLDEDARCDTMISR
ncbi:TCP-1/cpn60 chaperonin family-domain-containing protein [Suillus americanus]|nr:TCP-1/cpn60 chaperonin family-domain-containing protein [Suillus americanus]